MPVEIVTPQEVAQTERQVRNPIRAEPVADARAAIALARQAGSTRPSPNGPHKLPRRPSPPQPAQKQATPPSPTPSPAPQRAARPSAPPAPPPAVTADAGLAASRCAQQPAVAAASLPMRSPSPTFTVKYNVVLGLPPDISVPTPAAAPSSPGAGKDNFDARGDRAGRYRHQRGRRIPPPSEELPEAAVDGCSTGDDVRDQAQGVH